MAAEDDINAIAEHRYLFDAEFHAKAHAAAQILDRRYRAGGDRAMSQEQLVLAKHAAAIALVIAERQPQLGI